MTGLPLIIACILVLIAAFTAGWTVRDSWRRDKPIKQLNDELNQHSDYDGQ